MILSKEQMAVAARINALQLSGHANLASALCAMLKAQVNFNLKSK